MADDDVTDSLAAAADRGVTVNVIMTYSSEWRTAFKKLTAAGVHVRTYAGGTSAPLYIHAKMIVVDGDANTANGAPVNSATSGTATAFLGSENFSYTSLAQNRELGILFTNPAIIKSLLATFNADWQNAKPFTAY
jgi:phosphatidylserine/phosphatidylglycerophosphate/cardiolipin synthase-like enzyme